MSTLIRHLALASLLMSAACRPSASREAGLGAEPAAVPSAALAANTLLGPGAIPATAVTQPDIGGVPLPWRLEMPWVGQAEPPADWGAVSGGAGTPDPGPSPAAGVAAQVEAPAVGGAGSAAGGSCPGIVGRQGAELVLAGQPLRFLGVNATYLTEEDFPEDLVPGILEKLQQRGVSVVRVWFQEGQNPERLARLLDAGRGLGLRFIVTLGDNVHKGVDWFFSEEDEERYRPHLEGTVGRFKDRTEILAWEPINEPNCGEGRFDEACVKTIRDWVVGMARSIKGIDACHLVSSGMIGAGNFDLDQESYRRLHKKDEIDLISVHRGIETDAVLERELSADIGKPVFYGEIYDIANDDSCQPLRGGQGPGGRAGRVAGDLASAWEDGVAGYLLWDLNLGRLRKANGDDGYYCSKFGYPFEDPLWERLAADNLVPAPSGGPTAR